LTDSILAQAEELIHGDRAKEYGHPAENLGRIATLWSAYLKEEITAADVATMMILLKVARLKTGVGSRDTWIDIAGYAGLLELIDDAVNEAQVMIINGTRHIRVGNAWVED